MGPLYCAVLGCCVPGVSQPPPISLAEAAGVLQALPETSLSYSVSLLLKSL